MIRYTSHRPEPDRLLIEPIAASRKAVSASSTMKAVGPNTVSQSRATDAARPAAGLPGRGADRRLAAPGPAPEGLPLGVLRESNTAAM